MATPQEKDPFPCKLLLEIPFPTPSLSISALRALQVDAELSQLVTRSFSISPTSPTVLTVKYGAATNRMLRVAVNGFFESLGVVVHCMEELDVDVIGGPVREGLGGVQGLE